MAYSRISHQRRKEREYIYRGRYTKAVLYESFDTCNTCAYCGEWVDNKLQGDHVVPISAMEFLASKGCKIKSQTVPCCIDCNLIASDKLFKSFKEKKQFIQSKYLKKAEEKALWDEEEIDELGYGLRRQVEVYSKQKNIDTDRALYNNPNFIGEDHSKNPQFMELFSRYGTHLKPSDIRRSLKTFVIPDLLRRPHIKIGDLSQYNISRDLANCLVELEKIDFTVVNNVTTFYVSDIVRWSLAFQNELESKSQIFSEHRKKSRQGNK